MSQLKTNNITHISNTGDPNIVLGDSGDVQVQSLNSGPLSGFRNAIINGDFSVKQYFNNGTGSNKYITDRWVTNDSTFGATASVSDVKGASKGLKLEGGSRIIRQLVELPLDNSGNASPGQFYNGSQWTFSIYANVAPDQLSAGFVDTGTGVTNIQSVTGMPAWTATGDVQGAFTRYTCTFAVNTVPVASNRAFRVSWSFASTATFTLAQLELGPVATPFEHRPIGTELALCQRYFQRLALWGGVVCMGNDANRTARTPQRLSVKMRSTPDVENLVQDSAAIAVTQTGSTTTKAAPSAISPRADDLIEVNNLATSGGLQTIRYANASVDLNAEL